MKKIVNIFLSLYAVFSLSACEGMLEEKNYGNPTVSEMMSNSENVALMVGQAYADMQWIHDHWGYWGVSSLASDECVCPVRYPKLDWNDDGYWSRLNNHSWNANALAFEEIWNTTISGAVLCNKLIKTLTENRSAMSESVFNQYVGELEVARSYYYYLIFDCFGRIPYLEEFVEKTEPLMEPSVVWSRLVACLEKNAPNLPVVNDGNRAVNYGRVTQGFAYALLARLYLNAPSYDCTPENIDLSETFYQAYPEVTKIQTENDFYVNGLRCCDKVIDSQAYTIEADFFANFKVANEDSKENIFVIVEEGSDKDVREIPGSRMNKLRIQLLTLHYKHKGVLGMKTEPWNGFCARPGFIERYAENDVRGPGPIPPTPPTPPVPPYKDDFQNESDYQAALNEFKTGAGKQYLAELEAYEETAKGFGTQSKNRWGWFVGPIFNANGKIELDEFNLGSTIRPEVDFDAAKTKKVNNRDHGARCYKYEVDTKNPYSDNDFVLMRYADVLWMKAELLLRTGTNPKGWAESNSDFKTMMKRAFAYDGANAETAYTTAYPDVFSEQGILDERGRELAWEMTRRRDLIRFGRFNDSQYVDFVTATDAYRKWFPIPNAILQKSLINKETGMPYWTQNSGY